jgi:hypothetical protein
MNDMLHFNIKAVFFYFKVLFELFDLQLFKKNVMLPKEWGIVSYPVSNLLDGYNRSGHHK